MGFLTSLGALFALLGVAAGALGAHALRGHLDPAMQHAWETAAHYQLIHALALVILGLHGHQAPRPGARAAGIAFAAGIVLFSGSLDILALTGQPLWGAVTPFGGLALLAGWALLAAAFWPRRSA